MSTSAPERSMEQSLEHPTEDELLVGRVYLAMKAFNEAVQEVAQRGIRCDITTGFQPFDPNQPCAKADGSPVGAHQIYIRCYRRQEVVGIWYTGEFYGVTSIAPAAQVTQSDASHP
jgi:hypothetical protein